MTLERQLLNLFFLQICSSRGNLTIRWVTSLINKDIAGFYIVIRNAHNRILFEHHLPYDRRMDHIFGSEICEGNCQHLELCVLSKNSQGSINGWFDAQCVYLPPNFEDIRDKYTINFSQIYVIHSVRKQVRAKGVHAHDYRLSSDATHFAYPSTRQTTVLAIFPILIQNLLLN